MRVGGERLGAGDAERRRFARIALVVAGLLVMVEMVLVQTVGHQHYGCVALGCGFGVGPAAVWLAFCRHGRERG